MTEEERRENQEVVFRVRRAEAENRKHTFTIEDAGDDFIDVRPALLSHRELTDPGTHEPPPEPDPWHPWLEHSAEILLVVIIFLIVINLGRIISFG